jgi:hypothetical protein
MYSVHMEGPRRERDHTSGTLWRARTAAEKAEATTGCDRACGAGEGEEEGEGEGASGKTIVLLAILT